MSVDEFYYIFSLIAKCKEVFNKDVIQDIKFSLETMPSGEKVIDDIFEEIGTQILLQIMEKNNLFNKGGVNEICIIKSDIKNREIEFDILTPKPPLSTIEYNYQIPNKVKNAILSELYEFLKDKDLNLSEKDI